MEENLNKRDEEIEERLLDLGSWGYLPLRGEAAGAGGSGRRSIPGGGGAFTSA